MNKILTTLILGMIVGCASKEKATEKSAANGKMEIADPDVSSTNSADAAVSGENIGGNLKASPAAPGLDEAIQSQGDERIRKAATEALLQNSQDVKALNALALYHYKKGKFTAAKYLLTKAIAIQPSSALYNNLGVMHLAQDEQKEAVLAFRQAFNLDPQDGLAAANMGAIFVGEKDYNKAAVALETAYQKGYRDFKVTNNYAIALTATGKGAQAVPLYDRALKEQSNNKELLFNYAVLLIDNLKRYKEGNDVLNRLKFVGAPSEQRNRLKDLENKVRIGLQ